MFLALTIYNPPSIALFPLDLFTIVYFIFVIIRNGFVARPALGK